jgi:hypothetical protein
LKETFAAKIPGEIEKIKKLRKYADKNPISARSRFEALNKLE